MPRNFDSDDRQPSELSDADWNLREISQREESRSSGEEVQKPEPKDDDPWQLPIIGDWH